MRAAWRVIVADEAGRRAAYALEAVVTETMFVGGPLVLSAMLVLGHPAVPLLITAALLGIGGVGYAFTGAARTWRPEPHVGVRGRGRSPLRATGALLAMAVALMIAVGFGQLDLSLAATAQQVLGAQNRVGLLFMAIAGGSAVGGTLYGMRHWRGAEHLRLPFAVGAFASGLVLVTLLVSEGVGALSVLLPVLFSAGLAIAPAIIMLGNLIDEFAPRDRLGEAQAWLTTAFTAGAGAGTAVGGVLVDRGGPPMSFGGAALAVALAAVLAVTGRRVWHRAGAIGEHVARAESRQ
jgi:predicted MFS family arabinose efflux permease